jgi:hypothetical protein
MGDCGVCGFRGGGGVSLGPSGVGVWAGQGDVFWRKRGWAKCSGMGGCLGGGRLDRGVRRPPPGRGGRTLGRSGWGFELRVMWFIPLPPPPFLPFLFLPDGIFLSFTHLFFILSSLLSPFFLPVLLSLSLAFCFSSYRGCFSSDLLVARQRDWGGVNRHDLDAPGGGDNTDISELDWRGGRGGGKGCKLNQPHTVRKITLHPRGATTGGITWEVEGHVGRGLLGGGS